MDDRGPDLSEMHSGDKRALGWTIKWCRGYFVCDRFTKDVDLLMINAGKVFDALIIEIDIGDRFTIKIDDFIGCKDHWGKQFQEPVVCDRLDD